MKILNIITSVSGENSYSVKLADFIILKLLIDQPNSIVKTRNLVTDPLPHFDEVHLKSLLTPVEDHNSEMIDISIKTDELINEILEADALVIGVPMYNFGIPSTLKAWIDFISKPGRTFKYSKEGPIGLLPDKPVFLAISSGDVYTSGELKSFDHTEAYLRTMLGDFLGMKNIKAIRIEGVANPDFKEKALEKTLQEITDLVTL